MEFVRKWFLLIHLILVYTVLVFFDYPATGTYKWLENFIESVIIVISFIFFLWLIEDKK